MLKYLLFICTLALVWTACQAQDQSNSGDIYHLRAEQSVVALNPHALLWIDSTLSFGIQSLISNKTLAFTPLQAHSRPLSPRFAHWAKIRLINHLSSQIDWVFMTGWNDFVEVYVVKPDGSYQIKRSGELLPASQKDLAVGKKSKVSLKLLPEQEYTLYIRVERKNQEHPVLDLKLVQPAIWRQEIEERNLVQGLFQGILWIMLLYNFFIYLISRDQPYLYYSVYLFVSSIYFAHYYHLSAELWLREWPFLNSFLWLFSGVIVLAYFQFMRTFLNTAALIPFWDRVLRGWLRFGFGMIVSLFILYAFSYDFPLLLKINNNILLFEILLGMIILIKLYQHSNLLVRYFISGSFCLGLGSFLGAFLYLYVDYKQALYFAQAGIVAEVLLFSLGLGYRILRIERDKHKTQGELIAQLVENEKLHYKVTRELEEKVKQRTSELQQQKDKLEQLNLIKDKLFSVISHDLRSPLTTLEGSLKAIQMKLLSAEEEQRVFGHLEKNLQNTKMLLDNLLHWAMVQMEQVTIPEEEIDLYQLSTHTLDFNQELEKKNIRLQNHIPSGEVVFANQQMVQVILKNLVSNAIKFTPEGGEVHISSHSESDQVSITVEDTGVGMDDQEREKLFKLDTHFSTLGTDDERGNGLGLLLCREFVEKNGGRIWVESQKWKGSRFTFTLRKQPSQAEAPLSSPFIRQPFILLD